MEHKLQNIADLGKDTSCLHHIFGFDNHKRQNLLLADSTTLVYASSTAVVFENLENNEKQYLLSLDDNGVGCITTHQSSNHFAVGGKGFQPAISIYVYPDMEVVQTLNNGAERGYAGLDFNPTGNLLVSLSTSPDYMLTVWDWKENKILLHSKAFGQDVFNVKFSIYDDRRLTTCGTGHIRFWGMTDTFTGLKLQGNIGKFGKVELTDIGVFDELPDGKVVSGTETGHLLLWEGNFIKCRLVQSNNLLCHQGEITYIRLDSVENCVVTAGLDGFLRWWSLEKIDTADTDSDHSMDCVIKPLAEYFIGKEYGGIKDLVDSNVVNKQNDITSNEAYNRYFIVLTNKGYTLKINFTVKNTKIDKTRNFASVLSHSGPAGSGDKEIESKVAVLNEAHANTITSVDTSLTAHIAVTCSLDGYVRVWDYIGRRLLCSRYFSVHPTIVRWVPQAIIQSKKEEILIGFADGTVRGFSLVSESKSGKYSLNRKMVFKPHTQAVLDLQFNKNSVLATTGQDGVIFFFNCKSIDVTTDAWKPLHFYDFFSVSADDGLNTKSMTSTTSTVMAAIPGTYAEQICWNEDNKRLLCSCHDGSLRELNTEELLKVAPSRKPTATAAAAAAAEGDEDDDEDKEIGEQDSVMETESVPLVRIIAAGFTEMEEAVTASTRPVTPGASTAAAVTTTEVVAGASGEPETVDNEEDEVEEEEIDNRTLPLSMQRSVYLRSGNQVNIVTGALTTSNKKDLHRFVSFPLSEQVYSDTLVYAPSSKSVKAVSATAAASKKSFMSTGSRLLPSTTLISAIELGTGVYDNKAKIALKTPKTTTLRFSHTKKYVLVGYADGAVNIRPSDNYQTFIRVCPHNSLCGGVSAVASSYDDKFILSVGFDGVLVCTRIRLDLLPKRLIEVLPNVPMIDDPMMSANAHKTIVAWSRTARYPSYVYQMFSSDEKNLTLDESFKEFQTDPALSNHKKLINMFILSSATATTDVIPDIDANAFSIRDAKRKQDEGVRETQANIRKEKVRIALHELQQEYNEIRQMNTNLPECVRLQPQDLVIDDQYFTQLCLNGNDMVELVHKQNAYEAEKSAKLYSKAVNQLMSGLIFEDALLLGFNRYMYTKTTRPVYVRSFRTRGLDASISEVLTQVYEVIRLEKMELQRQLAMETAAQQALTAIQLIQGRLDQHTDLPTLEASQSRVQTSRSLVSAGGEGVDQSNSSYSLLNETNAAGVGTGDTHIVAGTGAAAGATLASSAALSRKRLRLERKAAIERHEHAKPQQDLEDEQNQKTVDNLKQTIGDFKLKTNADYEVPKNQRVNVEKKLKQLALLEESMVMIRMKFNERFLVLRELKVEIISAIKGYNNRIRDIDLEMKYATSSIANTTAASKDVGLWQPNLDPLEFPENRTLVTNDELDKYLLLRSQAQNSSNNANASWEKTPSVTHTILKPNLEIPRDKVTKQYEITQKPLLGTYEDYMLPIQPENINVINNNTDQQVDGAMVVGSGYAHVSGVMDVALAESEIDPTVLATFKMDPSTPSNTTSLSINSLEKEIASLVFAEHARKKKMFIMSNPSEFPAPVPAAVSTKTLSSRKPSFKSSKSIIIPLKEAVESSSKNSLLNAHQNQVKVHKLKLLTYERNILLQQIDELISNFDAAVDELRGDRHVILADLKQTELRLIHIFHEFRLLQTYEDRDIAIQQKQLHFITEKNEILSNINEYRTKLDTKLEEYRTWTEKSNAIYSELQSLIPENHPFTIILNKIFKKKIKRKILAANGEEQDDDDDEDDDDEDEDEEEEEEVEDTCPLGCDPHLHAHVLDLRLKRLDTEEKCSEIQKQSDEIKKMMDRFKQREKQIVKEAIQADLEMESFQKQKQMALNQIDITIPLKLSQVYAFENSGILTVPNDQPKVTEDEPTYSNIVEQIKILKSDYSQRKIYETLDIKSHVLFDSTKLSNLDTRISELHQLCDTATFNLLQHNKERSKLLNERKQKNIEIKHWEEKCNQLQMIKFGKLVDLDELEGETDKSKEFVIEQSIKKMEDDADKNAKDQKKSMGKLNDDLTMVIRRKTELLNMIYELTKSKVQVDNEFKNRNKKQNKVKLNPVDCQNEISEIAQQVKVQSNRIEALKVELFMLKRKDTSSLTMPMPTLVLPKPPSQTKRITGRAFPGKNYTNTMNNITTTAVSHSAPSSDYPSNNMILPPISAGASTLPNGLPSRNQHK